LNTGEEERLSDGPDEDDLDPEAAEDEFESEDEEVSAELEADFEGDLDGDGDEEDIEAVVELSAKEQSARSLEIRRALEERMERRQLQDDVDYLDMDLDD
jgi:hypothetical protein